MLRNIVLAMPLMVAVASVTSGDEFKSAKEARAEGAKQLRLRNFAAAQGPLEAALKLTPETDEKDRVDIYRALMNCYRQLPEIDKMMEAVEYIQQHGESQTERSLTAGDFGSFLHQRGKTDVAIARYEERLKTNAKDPSALAILTTIYLRLPGNQKERGKTLEGQLQALDRQRAAAKAERLAKLADAVPAAAASNWKDVAKAWLEGGDKNQAKAAIQRSLKSPPEERSTILAMYWHEGLGDVLLELGDREQAVSQFEAALPFASSDLLKKPIQAKVEKAKKP